MRGLGSIKSPEFELEQWQVWFREAFMRLYGPQISRFVCSTLRQLAPPKKYFASTGHCCTPGLVVWFGGLVWWFGISTSYVNNYSQIQ